MPSLFDSHCHLHFPSYGAAASEVYVRMRAAGVGAITVGTTVATSAGAVAYADAHDDVWAAVGFHPEHFSSSFHDEHEGDAGDFDYGALKRIAMSSKKVVAIGETGLDFFRVDEDRDVVEARAQQEKGFRDHLALAAELKLPVIIHCREALGRLAEIIDETQRAGTPVSGVVHCFTGTWEEAKPLLDLGLYLSFTGIITFPPKKTDDPERHVHRVIERMPLDRLLVETDAPWLTPVPHRGKMNEPAYVRFVAEKVAELRMTTYEDIATATTQNVKRLFLIP